MLFLCRFFALEVPNRWTSHVHTGQERTKMIWPKKSLTNLTRRNVFFLQLKFSMNQCANALQWILLKEDWFFSSKRLHGFRQVVQYALWHCKIINFQINTRTRLLIEDRQRQNQTKNQHPQKWLATSSLEDSCKRRQHCVISSWYGHKQNHKKRKNTDTHKAIPAGDRSNTAPCGNQGSPQPGSPRSQGAHRKV